MLIQSFGIMISKTLHFARRLVSTKMTNKVTKKKEKKYHNTVASIASEQNFNRKTRKMEEFINYVVVSVRLTITDGEYGCSKCVCISNRRS